MLTLQAIAFEKVCERAVEEAELMVQVHRDIFKKDCVVQVYGVAKGVPPPELLGLGMGAAAGEECVAIVMRLEAGGSLEAWLHGPAGAGAAASRTTAERLCMAVAVARGTDSHLFSPYSVCLCSWP